MMLPPHDFVHNDAFGNDAIVMLSPRGSAMMLSPRDFGDAFAPCLFWLFKADYYRVHSELSSSRHGK
jgi:hypothetical protein